MSEKISRIILTIEAILIVLPITGLAIFATYALIVNLFPPSLPIIFFVILALINLAAILSGWRLFIAFLRGGASNLQKHHSIWWLMILAGLLILIVSLLVVIILPSLGHTYKIRTASFILFGFLYASPLLIPLIHLALEKFVRKPTGEIEN
jgi:hypothetical protein